MDNKPDPQIGSSRAWLIWSLSALAFGYAFVQRVAPGVMVSDLMADFSIGAAVLGTLSALYFYPYVLLQIPLGALLDRVGARLLLTCALSVAGIGSLLFATAETLLFAYIGRFLIGVGSAVGFLGSLALATKWFPPHRFAFLAGLVMFFGMISAVFAQGPLASFVEAVGWRYAILTLGTAGLVLAAAIFTVVRNAPHEADGSMKPKENWSSIWKGLAKATSSLEVWKVALVASTMSGPMLTIGALWGTPYLVTAYDLDKTQAASFVSVIFLAWAFGAPFSGWVSDRIQRRKPLLIGGSFILACAMALLCFVPSLPLPAVIFLFAITGLSGATMAICFALVREVSPPQISGSVSGIVNSMTVASGAVLQPAVGFVLDAMWDGSTANGIATYTAANFQSGFLLVFASTVVGFLTTLFLRESPLWKGTGD